MGRYSAGFSASATASSGWPYTGCVRWVMLTRRESTFLASCSLRWAGRPGTGKVGRGRGWGPGGRSEVFRQAPLADVPVCSQSLFLPHVPRRRRQRSWLHMSGFRRTLCCSCRASPALLPPARSQVHEPAARLLVVPDEVLKLEQRLGVREGHAILRGPDGVELLVRVVHAALCAQGPREADVQVRAAMGGPCRAMPAPQVSKRRRQCSAHRQSPTSWPLRSPRGWPIHCGWCSLVISCASVAQSFLTGLGVQGMIQTGRNWGEAKGGLNGAREACPASIAQGAGEGWPSCLVSSWNSSLAYNASNSTAVIKQSCDHT